MMPGKSDYTESDIDHTEFASPDLNRAKPWVSSSYFIVILYFFLLSNLYYLYFFLILMFFCIIEPLGGKTLLLS